MKGKKISEKYTEKELAESFVFRNKLNDKENKQNVKDIASAREKLKTQSDKETSLRLKILQLKYQMEDNIQNPFDAGHTFGYFLKNYVNILKIKQYKLAEDLSLDETYLSQIINRHRFPSDEVFIRLELHSNNLINALVWYKLVEKEKENELGKNTSIRQKEKKHVKNTIGFA